MSFTDPTTLADNTPANQDFTRQNFVTNGSNWIETDASVALERTMSIRHVNVGPGVLGKGVPKQRHIVSFKHKELNSTTGKIEEAVMSFSLTVDPGAGVITAADLYHMRAFVEAFLTNTSIDQLVRGES